MKFYLFTARIDQKYGVCVYDALDSAAVIKMREWCSDVFGKPRYNRYIPAIWKQSFSTFYFMTEKQRNMFLLRWG